MQTMQTTSCRRCLMRGCLCRLCWEDSDHDDGHPQDTTPTKPDTVLDGSSPTETNSPTDHTCTYPHCPICGAGCDVPETPLPVTDHNDDKSLRQHCFCHCCSLCFDASLASSCAYCRYTVHDVTLTSTIAAHVDDVQHRTVMRMMMHVTQTRHRRNQTTMISKVQHDM